MVTAHLGALLIVLMTPLLQPVRITIVAVILASLAHICWHHFLRNSRHAVLSLKITRDGLQVETRSGGWLRAEILGSSFVTPWLTVLNLRFPHCRLPVNVVLLPDMLGPDDFRRVRVWLKWGNALTHGKDIDAVL